VVDGLVVGGRSERRLIRPDRRWAVEA